MIWLGRLASYVTINGYRLHLTDSNVLPKRLYLPEVDGLRGIAFVLVFLHHIPFPESWTESSDILARLHAFGWIGVDIFLVLSAYLLSKLAIHEFNATGSFNIQKFYVRRMIRIWPLYFMGLFIGFIIYPSLMLAAGSSLGRHLDSIRDHAIPYLLFSGNFSYATYHNTLGLYKSLWTVSLEEQFYLIFPLLMILLLPATTLRRPAVALLSVAAIAIIFRMQMQMVEVPYPWIWVSPATRLEPFAIGILLALFEERRGTLPSAGWLAILGAVITAALISSFPQISDSNHVIWQLAASTLVGSFLLCAARGSAITGLLASRPMATLGKLSFGLYVYHRFTIDLFSKITKTLGIDGQNVVTWCLAAVLCFGLTYAIALFSYRHFESYFLRKKQQFEIVPSRPVAL